MNILTHPELVAWEPAALAKLPEEFTLSQATDWCMGMVQARRGTYFLGGGGQSCLKAISWEALVGIRFSHQLTHTIEK